MLLEVQCRVPDVEKSTRELGIESLIRDLAEVCTKQCSFKEVHMKYPHASHATLSQNSRQPDLV